MNGPSSMPLRERARALPPFTEWHFRLAALLNWTTCSVAFVFPDVMAIVLDVPPPNYGYLVRAFAGLGIVFGFLYFEISRDPLRNRNLIKFGWIAKSVSFASVAHAFVTGAAHPAIFAFFVIEDLIWIPSFIYYDMKMRALALTAGTTP